MGDPDETISSRIGKIKRANGGKIPNSKPVVKLIDKFLDVVDKNHSIDAIEEDEGSNEIVITYADGTVVRHPMAHTYKSEVE